MSEFIHPCPLSSLQPNLANSSDRYERIKNHFKTMYGHEPAFYGRAPGRVNLIGEHIDYCGYAVLPMAVMQDIVIAATKNSVGRLRLANTDSRYESIEVDMENYAIDTSNPKWYHYFMCGYRGLLEHIGATGSISFDVLLDGTIPRCAGLSSSSALVCCAALVTMHLYSVQLSRLELAEICQRCERYVGTEGGGMDQSISFLANRGTAKLIEFNPIRTTDVVLPDGAMFVIANCCVEMNKAATDFFNVRVAECRLAAQVLAKLNGVADWRTIRRLVDVQTLLGLTSLSDCALLVERTLHRHPYSKDEICDILAVTPEDLDNTSLSERSRRVTAFKLHDRALHVFTEADRVRNFKSICERSSPHSLSELGSLMYRGHVSCRDLYECSCPELDSLVELAMQSGALGSRLTGAGWGGCTVSLVPNDKVDEFLQKVSEYYSSSPSLSVKISESLFASPPGEGAAIYLHQ